MGKTWLSSRKGFEILNWRVENFSKKFEKPLDKQPKVCYNKYTEMRKGRPKRLPTRASKTFPPKTSHRKVCRFAVYKCEPEPRGWRNVGLCRLQSQFNMWVQSGGRTHWRVNREVRLLTTHTNFPYSYLLSEFASTTQGWGFFSLTRESAARTQGNVHNFLGRSLCNLYIDKCPHTVV